MHQAEEIQEVGAWLVRFSIPFHAWCGGYSAENRLSSTHL
jgi:hypothetical protein